MKNLVLSALLVTVAAQAAGCIFVSDDDDRGRFEVAWTLKSDEQTVTCPPNADRATIYSLAAADANNPDLAYKDLWDCGDGSGNTQLLPPDNYLVWVQLEDANGGLIARSLSEEATLTPSDTVAVRPVEIQVTHGFIEFAWTLSRDGAPIECADVLGEDYVSLDTTVCGTDGCGPDDMPLPLPDVFTCEDHSGRTYPVPVGDFVASISIIDDPTPDVLDNGDAVPLGVADAINGTIRFGGDVDSLGTVDIPVTVNAR